VGVITFYAKESSAFDDAHRRLAAAAGSVVARTITEVFHLRVPSAVSAVQNGTHARRGQKAG
jgi:hypothetical protein